MKTPTSYSRSSDRADAAMTPMIDVVFLLLIFFVWTASFQAIEAILPSQLTAPGDLGAKADLPNEDFERIVVRILEQDGQVGWLLNSQPIATLEQLQQQLDRLARIKADLPIVVDPMENIVFGDVIKVYDTCLRVGLTNIQFTTRG